MAPAAEDRLMCWKTLRLLSLQAFEPPGNG